MPVPFSIRVSGWKQQTRRWGGEGDTHKRSDRVTLPPLFTRIPFTIDRSSLHETEGSWVSVPIAPRIVYKTSAELPPRFSKLTPTFVSFFSSLVPRPSRPLPSGLPASLPVSLAAATRCQTTREIVCITSPVCRTLAPVLPQSTFESRHDRYKTAPGSQCNAIDQIELSRALSRTWNPPLHTDVCTWKGSRYVSHVSLHMPLRRPRVTHNLFRHGYVRAKELWLTSCSLNPVTVARGTLIRDSRLIFWSKGTGW